MQEQTPMSFQHTYIQLFEYYAASIPNEKTYQQPFLTQTESNIVTVWIILDIKMDIRANYSLYSGFSQRLEYIWAMLMTMTNNYLKGIWMSLWIWVNIKTHNCHCAIYPWIRLFCRLSAWVLLFYPDLQSLQIMKDWNLNSITTCILKYKKCIVFQPNWFKWKYLIRLQIIIYLNCVEQVPTRD